MEGFDWGSAFALLPTVAATVVIVKLLVDFFKKLGWVAPDKALIWSGAINALFYVGLYLAGQFGYETQVNDTIALINANVDVLAAALSLVALAATSTGGTKLLHETLKKLLPWWEDLGTKG